MVRNLIKICIVLILILPVLRLTSYREDMRPLSKDRKDSIAKITENLRRHVYKLSYEIGDRNLFNYRNLIRARDYIVSEFRLLGYEISLQNYVVENKQVSNIIAYKKSHKDTLDTIVLGAHYDSCFNPGADDNASGVAVLIETARMCKDIDLKKNIEFVAFVNEEPPFFKTENMGSVVYVKRSVNSGKKITGTIILEMVGYFSELPNSQQYPPLLNLFYPSEGNFIAVVGNLSSRELVRKVKYSFQSASSLPIESLVAPPIILGIDFSDHWAFWQHGYKAVMLTDTAFYRNDNYHTQNDTYDTLDYFKMGQLVFGLKDVLYRLSLNE